uniref:SCD domain-containing protein n=1 Tax=Ornithorhynchus anatinus TaxID=9258 RepID=A0A6I8PCK3_ORNAN
MGGWLRMHPTMFLNDSYLKYVGWMLYDKQPEVRLKCLLGLKGLYDRKDLAFKMDLFSSRFKERVVSMTLDKDCRVAVEAVKLLMLMSRLLDSAPSQGERVSAKGGRSGVGRLKWLLAFFLEGEMHSHVTYLVDSLWDWAADLLKDWECMTALLLGDVGDEEAALTPAQETALVEMVAVTVRQAAEGRPPAGRAAARKVLSAKERRVRLEDRARITAHFSATLPRLLDKFSDDAGKAADLLRILRYFDRDAYGGGDAEKVKAGRPGGREGPGPEPRPAAPLVPTPGPVLTPGPRPRLSSQHGSELVRLVTELVLRHRDPGVLEACAVAFAVLCGLEPSGPGGAAPARARLMDRLGARLARLLEDSLGEGEGLRADEEGVAQISATLQRISAFYSTHDLSGRNVSGETERLLAVGAEHGSLPVQIALPALQCGYFGLLWQLASAAEGPLSEDDTEELKSRVRRFCRVCRPYLGRPEEDLSEKAFALLCDLLFASSRRGRRDGGGAGGPFLPPDPELRSAILGFVRRRVLAEETDGASGSAETAAEGPEEERRVGRERQLTALPRRRSLLAGYCRLIASDVVDAAAAAEVFSHYVKAYDDFGDIIRETLSRTRHNSPTGAARALVLCLREAFRRQPGARGAPGESAGPPLAHVRELARRFSLTFGWDPAKSREAVTAIHKEGIEFAFERPPGAAGDAHPPNLSFLTVVGEFSGRLLKPDRRLVYGYLRRFVPEREDPGPGEGWRPLVCYRNSLLTGPEEDGAGPAGFRPPPAPPQGSSSLKRKDPGASRDRPPPAPGGPADGETAAGARKRLRFPERGAAAPEPGEAPGGGRRGPGPPALLLFPVAFFPRSHSSFPLSPSLLPLFSFPFFLSLILFLSPPSLSCFFPLLSFSLFLSFLPLVFSLSHFLFPLSLPLFFPFSGSASFPPSIFLFFFLSLFLFSFPPFSFSVSRFLFPSFPLLPFVFSLSLSLPFSFLLSLPLFLSHSFHSPSLPFFSPSFSYSLFFSFLSLSTRPFFSSCLSSFCLFLSFPSSPSFLFPLLFSFLFLCTPPFLLYFIYLFLSIFSHSFLSSIFFFSFQSPSFSLLLFCFLFPLFSLSFL